MGRVNKKDKITAATILLINKGECVTLERLAAASKVSKSGILYHFPSLWEVLQHAFICGLGENERKRTESLVSGMQGLPKMEIAYIAHLISPPPPPDES